MKRRRTYYIPEQRGEFRARLTRVSQAIGHGFDRVLFDCEGSPRLLLRTLLFDAYRRARPAFDGLVYRRHDRPRRAFAGWMAKGEDLLPPLVAQVPFPEPDPAGVAAERRRVLIAVEGDVGPLAALVAQAAGNWEVVLLRLDGASGAGLPAVEVAVDVARARVPRPVLVDALAMRAATLKPLFALAVGAGLADLTDSLERRGVPVVALVDDVDTRAPDAFPLERVLARASAVVFPSEAARDAALRRLPQFAGRWRVFAMEEPLGAGTGQVLALGREVGEEVDNELAVILATYPERLDVLSIKHETDPPGDLAPLQKLEHQIFEWRKRTLLRRPINTPPMRRDYSGFHPLIYAEHHPVACFDQRRYPLAHWLQNGCPPGPWAVPVTGPLDRPRASRLTSALHGHFYYPDLFPEMLERLSVNASRPDLFLTTDTAAKAEELRAMTADYPARVRIDVVPNIGRDIGPFLTALRDVLTGNDYDVVFHVHGKKTKGRRRAIGDPWRNFLWGNMIGGEHPMLDTVLALMEAQPEVGLVYPEDTHLLDWALNKPVVEELCEDIGLPEKRGKYVDFPVGNMFAARPAALAPALALDLRWEDYPAEPIPDDGTVLHGLERLLPAVVRKAGYSPAAVRVPHTGWD
ncbi:rhamnan synthesis F family protein [Starkeya koreensis]|uniref:Rhamnan synthesis F family protein n=1 Tax=Ancylobacter koreensis TaxID=266121 RepID=A0ABT0DRD6_9HYPH|nr:rhamnan synthesis F family protein [Ancylobacter koreensis]